MRSNFCESPANGAVAVYRSWSTLVALVNEFPLFVSLDSSSDESFTVGGLFHRNRTRKQRAWISCRVHRLTTSHIVKYSRSVQIVTRKHLRQAMESYPDAANEIKTWTAIVEAVRWHNFDDVRCMFKHADSVDGYVIFNIRHNRYRLITVIHYAKTTKERQTQGHVYIRSFLTHNEYDNRNNWDRRYGKL